MFTFTKLADAVVFLVYEYAISDDEEQFEGLPESSRVSRDFIRERLGNGMGSRQIEGAIDLAQERGHLEKGMTSYIGLTLTGAGIAAIENDSTKYKNAFLKISSLREADAGRPSSPISHRDSPWIGQTR